MKPKKILFANVPFDGHFNPLTGLAVHLKQSGYDVRWYTQDSYAEKIGRLGIPFYGFKRAPKVDQHNPDNSFPERRKIKSQTGKLRYDLEHVFIRTAVPYFEDIKEIYESFRFDVFIADIAFTGAPLVKAKLNVPAIAVGVLPLGETSTDLPPSGLGLTPSNSGFGKFKQTLMRWATDKFIFNNANKLYRRIFSEFGISAPAGNVFDVVYRSATLVLQSGTSNFEYKRSDMGENIRFIGPLLPYSMQKKQQYKLDAKYDKYESKILVTQGTVEKDPKKLIVPVLEAFRNTNHLVIVTTGGSNTKELRERYPDENFIIEDFIPFNDIMPYCDVYVTNGGYGGVMLGIENNLPMVVAGIHEGKNEINARVGYFDLGINLKTEFPKPDEVRKAIHEVLADGKYKTNVIRLAEDFRRYDSNLLCEAYVTELTMKSPWATNIKRFHSNGEEKFVKVY